MTDRTYDQKAKRYLDEAFGELVNDCLDDPIDAANHIEDLRDEIERLRAFIKSLVNTWDSYDDTAHFGAIIAAKTEIAKWS